MKHLELQLPRILNKLKDYATQPSAYRVCVLCGGPLSHKTTVARKLSEELDGQYIDVLADKLMGEQRSVTLHGPTDFKKDIGQWSKETNSLLVVDEIEPLLDIWPRNAQEDLLKLLSKWRTDCVILLVTRLNLPFEDYLGKERVFRLGKMGGADYVE